MSRRPLVLVTLLASASLPAVAHALACGDTVGPGGTVRIASDLGPCSAEFALRVVGPVTLDLGASTITCKNGSGLELTGRTVKVKGGRLVGCNRGIVFASGSGHRVERTQIDGVGFLGLHLTKNSDRARITDVTIDDGFAGVQIDAGSDRHQLEHVDSVGASFAGYVVDGSRNLLDDCDADASRIGFRIEGTRNTLHDDDVTNATEAGYVISGAGHTLTDNDARDTSGDGFRIEDARDVKLLRGRATGGEGAGYRVEDSRNILLDDVESDLNAGDGIVVSETIDVDIRRTVVRANDGHGIHVRAVDVDRVHVRDNFVRGHLAPAFDLRDDAADCGATLWQRNTFDRGFPSCVQ